MSLFVSKVILLTIYLLILTMSERSDINIVVEINYMINSFILVASSQHLSLSE